jgi:regulator of protease activity HflC (stomatin/prohibitin superfamily)
MGGIVAIIFMIIGFIVAIPGWLVHVRKYDSSDDHSEFASFWFGLIGTIVGVIFLIVVLCLSFTAIDAGEVGVQTKFGKVLNETLTEGFHSKSPLVSVHTYSVRMNEYTMSRALGEGVKHENDAITTRTSDNLEVGIDMTVRWSVNPQKAQLVYKNISPDMQGIIDIIVRPSSRAYLRDIASDYTLDNLIIKRTEVASRVFDMLKLEFEEQGLIIETVLLRDIYPPTEIDTAIKKKLARDQELKEMEYQEKIAEKNASIRRIEAQGIADAQKIIQKELTPIYVQYEAIQAYKELAGSPNTTFVILPTDPKGAGMPLILGAK